MTTETAFVHWQVPRVDSGLGSTAFLLATLATSQQSNDLALMQKLAQAVMNQQEASGRFSTDFLKPDREVDQLYYPGEAMLALIRYYRVNENPDCLHALQSAYQWYRSVWDNEKKAPFVPWQVRCYAELYEITEDKRYRDYCFELQDWLLASHSPVSLVQGLEQGGALSGALASTGVYSEGLVAAYGLARLSGDLAHMEKYGRALFGCMRYLMALQFKEEDVYWVHSPEKVRGALATKPYENELRLDFTYHAMSAMHMVTQLMTPEQWNELRHEQ